MTTKCLLFYLAAASAWAQAAERVDLGQLQTGATVSFVQGAGGDWGIEIFGAPPRMLQPKPAKLEVYYTEQDIRQLAVGYKTVEKSAAGIEARAEIAGASNVVFHVWDRWSLSESVVSVSRKVEVTGNAPGGFYSSVVLTVDPDIGWSAVNCLAPGALYGDPTYDGERSPGGTLNYAARRFIMREDILAAPMFALSFSNGTSVSLLNPAPRGDTTVEETRLAKPVIIDARLQFGAMGAWQANGQPIELGFRFPGTSESMGGHARPRRAFGTKNDPAISPDHSGRGP